LQIGQSQSRTVSGSSANSKQTFPQWQLSLINVQFRNGREDCLPHNANRITIKVGGMWPLVSIRTMRGPQLRCTIWSGDSHKWRATMLGYSILQFEQTKNATNQMPDRRRAITLRQRCPIIADTSIQHQIPRRHVIRDQTEKERRPRSPPHAIPPPMAAPAHCLARRYPASRKWATAVSI